MKILQFGTGVFLRGFFDWMVENLNNKKLIDASVTMVKLTPHGDLGNYLKQNGNYHIVIRGLQDGKSINELQQISCINKFIHPYQEWAEFLASAEDEEYKLIVSNSTEAGLCYENSSAFEECPSSFPAKLYAWLHKRFLHFSGSTASGVQIMACELVPDNANKLKEILLQHAEDHGTRDFAKWLENSCHFINTLVDRIVSKVPVDEMSLLQKEWSVDDKLMLCAEPYHFLATDSPELEKILPLQKAGLNVAVTDNLDAVRERKVKVLNGAHMLVVPAGLLLEKEVVAETLQHEKLRAFTETCLAEEVATTLKDKGIKSYIASVIERFENPFLNHRLENIALNSAAKIGQRLFPSIQDFFHQNGHYPEKLLLAVAIYLEFTKGEIVEPGVTKTCWGVLKDNAAALEFISSLHSMTGEQAAQAIIDTKFWPVTNEMKVSFSQAMGKAIERVRTEGVENCI